MLFAAEDARSYIGSMTLSEFAANGLVRNAVLHCLAIIGEAANRIAVEAYSELPQLPWRDMVDLRNFIVHEYENVNMPIIWDVIQRDLPVLIDKLDRLFPERHA